MKPAKPKISVVIAVYNESDTILRCLNAIAAQTVKPYEVIAVDNNCTDDTVAKINAFKKLKVKVLNEPIQGVTAARNRGFNAVQGDIICRVDADTFLAPNWLEVAQNAFVADPKLAVVSGMLGFYDAPFKKFAAWLFKLFCYDFNTFSLRQSNVHGGSMALTKKAWQKIGEKCCTDGGFAEDSDLSIHASKAGLKIRLVPDLYADASARRWKVGFINYYKHLLPWIRVLKRHGLNPVNYWLLILVAFPLATVLTRPLRWAILSYDEPSNKMLLGKLFEARQPDRKIPS